MKNTYFLSLILIFSSIISYAQKSNPNMERIKAMKVAMITEKLELTEDQAKTFWPTYYKFEGERRQINRSVREKMRANSSSSNLTEEEELAMQDEVFELRTREAELAKKYRPQFLKSISAKQYSDLVLAEKQFNQMLLRELNERRRGGREK